MNLPFDLPDSLLINRARLEHLSSLGLDLEGKSVLEPGAGVGLLTQFWEQRGCAVLSTELQAENVAENLARHPWRKGLLCRAVDSGFKELGRFDIVFCYGLLYHVPHPARCLTDMAEVCDGLLLLETIVHHTDDGLTHPVEHRFGRDQGAAGHAYWPARNWVMQELSTLMPHVYVSRTQPNFPDYALTWPSKQSVSRSVFVASREPLNLPTLLPALPLIQERFLAP